MGFQSLADWLAYQETLHPKAIDLGLERVRAVLGRLELPASPALTISVAGTNGKGSSIAMLDSILRASGYRVGTYTSPHILRYNERISIDGKPVDDQSLLRVFERIEGARGGLSLSFFEFGTLAALILFSEHPLDFRLLEVGLGGRLDAVNVVDADLALIASIDIDHQEWLGDDRAAIGLEKAGIMRRGRPAVLGDRSIPDEVLDFARDLGVVLYRSGIEFDYERGDSSWFFRSGEKDIGPLPQPALKGEHQYLNAAAVLQCLELLPPQLRPSVSAVVAGLSSVRLPGRFQLFEGPVPVLLDVAHNPQAVRVLADFLDRQYPDVGIRAVFAVMRDKDVDSMVRVMKPRVLEWYLAPLNMTRAATPVELTEILHNAGAGEVFTGYAGVLDAVSSARIASRPGDLLLVFGSFFLVSDYLATFDC